MFSERVRAMALVQAAPLAAQTTLRGATLPACVRNCVPGMVLHFAFGESFFIVKPGEHCIQGVFLKPDWASAHLPRRRYTANARTGPLDEVTWERQGFLRNRLWQLHTTAEDTPVVGYVEVVARTADALVMEDVPPRP